MKTIRARLTYANVMSTLAVFLVLGGAGAVAAVKLGKNSVGTRQLKENAVTTAKIKDGAVTGSKINLSSLGTVPNATNAINATNAKTADTATNAKTADTATTATNAVDAGNAKTAETAAMATDSRSLGGLLASGYTRSECNSQTGAVKGFATVNGAAVSHTELSTAGVEFPYNCSGGEILAAGLSGVFTGLYVVKFVGSPMLIATVTPVGQTVASAAIETEGPGHFAVFLRNGAGEPVKGSFNILAP